MTIDVLSLSQWIAAILGAIYFLILAAVYLGISRLKKKPVSGPQPSVSIVVAARNEEARIPPCLESLSRLDYPQEKLQIVLMDDCSNDGTTGLMKAFCQSHSNRICLSLTAKDPELQGKMKALSEGISAAKGEIIFVTDADCEVPATWVKNMVRYFRPGVSMVLGHSPLHRGKGFRFRFLQFDNLLGAISIAAPAKMGFPYASAGRNLAYRKAAFHKVGGYTALRNRRSGDDTHLTERFRTQHAGTIDFCADPETFVLTRPPTTGGQLFHQQVRKNSRHFRKSAASVSLTGMLLLSYLAPFWLLGFREIRAVALLFLGIRALWEFACLAKAAWALQQRDLVAYLPAMQIIYPPFILFFSALGFFKLYRWKP